MFITLIITFSLFFFVLFLVYLIYCYAYYDENKVNFYTEIFNKGQYKEVYEELENDSDLTYQDFSKVIKLMYDKGNLKNIYYLYYSDEMSLDDFVGIFYYGNSKVASDDIVFKEEGITNLVERKDFSYKEINVENRDGYKSSLGLKRNIKFEVENNSTLILDDKELVCIDNECLVDSLFGGLHVIEYNSNDIDYYGIINVWEDKQIIKIAQENSLVKKNKADEEEVVKVIEDLNLNKGKYELKECYLSSGCPSKKKSYINLSENGEAIFYTYITLDQAGDYYKGTYLVEGEFLVLKFNNHIYTVFDYDTKQSTDIEADVDIEFRFKIEDNKTIKNSDYLFEYSI